MNKAALATYFGLSEEVQALNAYEEAIFEIKNHFLQKPWLQLTAKARFKQLIALREIEQGTSMSATQVIPQTEFSTVIQWWNAWQVERNQLKRQIAVLENATEILPLIEYGFAVDKAFSVCVPSCDWSEETPLFGKEPDVMTIQKEIMALDALELRTFAELYAQKDICSQALLLALKRWSLLSQYL